MHEKPHCDAVHSAVALLGAAQALSQPPQLSGLIVMSTHEAPHVVSPDGHVVTQSPLAQT
ncbi:MAG: hypothetical protein U0235_23520 [Polyangiaceae bacterium]